MAGPWTLRWLAMLGSLPWGAFPSSVAKPQCCCEPPRSLGSNGISFIQCSLQPCHTSLSTSHVCCIHILLLHLITQAFSLLLLVRYNFAIWSQSVSQTL